MEYDMREEERLVEAFHMMWDNYPEPVRLIRRDNLVVAGNPRYMQTGGVLGVRCIEQGDPSIHRGCMAQAALRDHETKTKETDVAGVHWVSFWVPVSGSDYYHVHFTNGINASIEQAMTAAEAAERA